MEIDKCTDKELASWHTFFIYMFDNINAGKIDCSGVTYDMVERILVKIIKEEARRHPHNAEEARARYSKEVRA